MQPGPRRDVHQCVQAELLDPAPQQRVEARLRHPEAGRRLGLRQSARRCELTDAAHQLRSQREIPGFLHRISARRHGRHYLSSEINAAEPGDRVQLGFERPVTPGADDCPACNPPSASGDADGAALGRVIGRRQSV